MKTFEKTAMHEILNQTQNIFVEMDNVEQLLNEIPLDSMNWFLMSAFVNDLNHHLQKMRKRIDQSRPSPTVRKLLLESYLGAVS